MDNDDKRMEFSVRQGLSGAQILRVRTFESYPSSGEWMDAGSKHLPEFFRRVNLSTTPNR